MTNKEINKVIQFGSSHIMPLPNLPIGITKFQAFLALRPLLKGKKYWMALKSAFISSDDLYDYRIDIKLAFSSKEAERERLMTREERSYLDRLPNKFTIYRGMTVSEKRSGDFGVSWTLKKERAEFFAYEYFRNYATRKKAKTIHSLDVCKEDIIAYFNERGEEEIIYIHKPISFI